MTEATSIILQMKYARIIVLLSQMLDITVEEAMSIFYNSKTFEIISNDECDMYTMSDKYLAEEVRMEIRQ